MLWPGYAKFFFKSCRGCAALVIRGSESLLEGVTQGDPLSICSSFYLIYSLDDLDSGMHGVQMMCQPVALLRH